MKEQSIPLNEHLKIVNSIRSNHLIWEDNLLDVSTIDSCDVRLPKEQVKKFRDGYTILIQFIANAIGIDYKKLTPLDLIKYVDGNLKGLLKKCPNCKTNQSLEFVNHRFEELGFSPRRKVLCGICKKEGDFGYDDKIAMKKWNENC